MFSNSRQSSKVPTFAADTLAAQTAALYGQLLDNCPDIKTLRRLHCRYILDPVLCSNTYLSIKLMRAYGACKQPKVTRQLFDGIPDKGVVVFNVMIRSYVNNQFHNDALHLFRTMNVSDCRPDIYTLPLALKACSVSMDLNLGSQVHAFVAKSSLDSNIYVGNGLISMYGKCGCLVEARQVLDEMSYRDVVSWNSMVAGYAQNHSFDDALEVCREMESLMVKPDAEQDPVTISTVLPACGDLSAVTMGRRIHDYVDQRGLRPNLAVENALIDMYANCGCLQEARKVFDTMHFRDVVSWTSMISAYAMLGYWRKGSTSTT